MLTLSGVSKAYGARMLFEDVSLHVARTDRIGVVGPNGAGKSTLFRLVAGEEAPDAGTIQWERGADFGYLPQETAPVDDTTVLRLVAGPEQEDDFARESRALAILAGLGFRAGDAERPLRTFSGGWVMRAHLARLLVAQPALLLLDEPTNHLDLPALLWLQDHVQRAPGGLLLISHDRAFLNAVCTHTLEVRAGGVERFTGHYDSYMRQREERHAQLEAKFKNQQREIERLQRFVDRFGAKATLASRAKSMEKRIARLRDEAVEEPERDLRRVQFRFPQPPRSALRVVRLEKVRQAYGERVVYRGDLDLTLERGARTVLVGPNGAGKSTLLKILAGLVPIQGGVREIGEGVVIGYFAQNRTDTLRVEATVLDNILELRTPANDLTEQRARTLLGAFLFREDDVNKPVRVLSGGEKSRLALCRLLVDPPNLLLLDEPTTHLDIPSMDALVHALSLYEGTLVFISHDVFFIRAAARTVIRVDDGVLTHFAGDFDYYLEKSGQADARFGTIAPGSCRADGPAASAGVVRSGPKGKDQRRLEAQHRQARAAAARAARAEVQRCEEEVIRLEARQHELLKESESPAAYAAPGRAAALHRELARVVAELEAANAAWERATHTLQELG